MKKALGLFSLLTFLFFTGCGSLPFFGSDEDEKPPITSAKPEPAPAPDTSAEASAENHSDRAADSTPLLPKKKLVVLNFVNRSSYGGKELGQYAADEVKSALSHVSDFILIPEEQLEESEKFSTNSGAFNYKLIFDVARNHGAIGVITGTIDDMDIRERGDEVGLFQTRYQTVNTSVRYQFFDATTEKLLYSKNSNAELTEEHTRFFSSREPSALDPTRGQGAVSKALEKTYPHLMVQAKKLSWVGKIAKAGFNRFYVNAGEASGITKGQLLKVFEEGNTIVDGQSKTVLGIAPGRFKGILKVVDNFGTDGSIAILHSGGNFREKDRVEIFTPPTH
jgi:hypothetical protein